jgi:ABC-type protease/lipase transport system fused ATPase/permease subunit
MRHARPAFSALSAQVWRATAIAVLFTVAASVLALALPLVIMHAIEAAERRQSIHGLALIGLIAVGAAVLRSILLAARDRILLQSALWLEHTAGAAVLSDRLSRGVMPETLAADRAALDRCARAIAGPAVASVLDTIAAAVPMAVLFAIHPALGVISLLCVSGLIASGLVRARASAASFAKIAATRAAADDAWRTAAANGPMIAARRMSSGIVADWTTLSRAAVVGAYGLARPGRRMAAVLRAIDMVSCIFIACVGVALVHADSLTVSSLVGALLLHITASRAILAAHDRVSELAACEAGWAHLSAPAAAMADRAVTNDPPAAMTAAPSVGQVSAQAAPMPIPAAVTVGSQRPSAHPARPVFDNPAFETSAFAASAPLPMARPPAAYATSNKCGGH